MFRSLNAFVLRRPKPKHSVEDRKLLHRLEEVKTRLLQEHVSLQELQQMFVSSSLFPLSSLSLPPSFPPSPLSFTTNSAPEVSEDRFVRLYRVAEKLRQGKSYTSDSEKAKKKKTKMSLKEIKRREKKEKKAKKVGFLFNLLFPLSLNFSLVTLSLPHFSFLLLTSLLHCVQKRQLLELVAAHQEQEHRLGDLQANLDTLVYSLQGGLPQGLRYPDSSEFPLTREMGGFGGLGSGFDERGQGERGQGGAGPGPDREGEGEADVPVTMELPQHFLVFDDDDVSDIGDVL
jgi:hypothetical protein